MTVRARILAASMILAGILAGCSGPQSALDSKGPAAAAIAGLWWAMLAGATVIVLIVMGILGAALFRHRDQYPERINEMSSRRLVLFGGFVIPLVILFVLLIASILVGKTSGGTGPGDAMAVEITGKQWWWDVAYLDPAGNILARTANEIHIPAGQNIRFILKSTDVIHSFWVPNLQGKTDLIPGRTNLSWVKADQPGVFRGQCAEFCGAQHAHMGFEVIAQPRADFEEWLRWQSQPAIDPATAEAREGQQVFLTQPCILCHAIRGTLAGASVGPDLTHIAGRRKIAAATLANNRGHLAGWIVNAQSIKPGVRMPRINVESEKLTPLLDYLGTLQ